MKITINNYPEPYSGPLGFIAQMVVMALATVLAAYIMPGVHIDTFWAAILTAAVIALLNNFIRPILIVLTLPFTIVTMGFFLLTAINYLLEIPNRLMRRPDYQPSDSQAHDIHTDTDEDGFTPYEEINDDNK